MPGKRAIFIFFTLRSSLNNIIKEKDKGMRIQGKTRRGGGETEGMENIFF